MLILFEAKLKASAVRLNRRLWCGLFEKGLVFALPFVLVACGQSNSINSNTPSSLSGPAPVNLNSGRNVGQSDAPASVQMAVPRQVAERAIENYRINKKAKKGPFQYHGADLNGDGRAEILVYMTGEEWCAKTGCTVGVLVSNGRHYRSITSIRRVKLPIRISGKDTNGWRDLIVNTGGVGAPEQTVILQFTGRGYPGNATLIPSVRAAELPPAEEVFTAQIAAQ